MSLSLFFCLRFRPWFLSGAVRSSTLVYVDVGTHRLNVRNIAIQQRVVQPPYVGIFNSFSPVIEI